MAKLVRIQGSQPNKSATAVPQHTSAKKSAYPSLLNEWNVFADVFNAFGTAFRIYKWVVLSMVILDIILLQVF